MVRETVVSRSPGLDLARALAIAAVLAAHSGMFFARFWPGMSGVSFWSGVLGVELFFALSGLLIGKILFRDVLPHRSFRKLGIFFLRRWMRTLPAYYAVLALLAMHALATGGPLPRIWRYLAFLQNCPPESAAFFPVSWSLSLEQWAYVAIPPLLLAAAFLPLSVRRERCFLWCMIAAAVFCAILRLYTAAEAPAAWDEAFRKQVPFRLDAVLFGVGVAWLRQYCPGIHAKLGQGWVFAFSLLCVWMFARHYWGSVFQVEGNIFLKSFGFSVVDMLLALSLCFFDCNLPLRHALNPTALLERFAVENGSRSGDRESGHPRRMSGKTTLFPRNDGSAAFERDTIQKQNALGKLALLGSRYAYSLYLAHWTPFVFFAHRAATSSLWGVMVFYLFALAGTFMLAYMLYRMVEKPCMRLRPEF